MSAAKINNEIILLRKYAQQARVHIIQKLTKAISQLRQKKGTEAQKVKNQRKVKRMVAEIFAVKKVKKDIITKYILTNVLNSKGILENQNSKPLTRIMFKIGNNERFKEKILEFKNKYPNYIKFLAPNQKDKIEYKFAYVQAFNNIKPGKSSEFSEKGSEALSNKLKIYEDLVHNNKNMVYLNNKVLQNSFHHKNEKIKFDIIEKKKLETNENVRTLYKNEVEKEVKQQKKGEQEEIIQNREYVSEDLSIVNSQKKSTYSGMVNKREILKRHQNTSKENSGLDQEQKIVISFIKSNGKIGEKIDSFFVSGDEETNSLCAFSSKHALIELTEGSDDVTNELYTQTTRFLKNASQSKNRSFNCSLNKLVSQSRNRQKKVKYSEKQKTRSIQIFRKSKIEPKENSNSLSLKTSFKDQSNEILHPSWLAKKKTTRNAETKISRKENYLQG